MLMDRVPERIHPEIFQSQSLKARLFRRQNARMTLAPCRGRLLTQSTKYCRGENAPGAVQAVCPARMMRKKVSACKT